MIRKLALMVMLGANFLFASLPTAAADQDWSGPYVGFYAGQATGQTTDDIATFLYGSPGVSYIDTWSLDGAATGAYAGYNYTSGSYVVGLEADIGHASVDGYIDFAGNGSIGAYRTDVAMGWNGHLRLRAGVAAENALFFVAGGVALAQFDYGYNWPPDPNQIYHDQAQYVGLSVGAGVDYAISPAATLRAEYLYDNFGKHRFDFQGTDNISYYRAEDIVSFQTQTVRIGLSFRF
jgi:outer membrane immunogenic protein